MTEHEYQRKFQEEFEKYQQENHVLPNIMVLGKVGVGKSSAINTIFGREVAKVSSIVPETQEFKVYKGEENDSYVNLIDSKGYELNIGVGDSNQAYETAGQAFDKYIETIMEYIDKNSSDTLKKVHLIWYCISVAETKIEELDIRTLKRLNKDSRLKNKIAVVLTKCDQDDEEGSTARAIKEVLEKENINVPSFEISNDPSLKLDLEKMVKWSEDSLEEQDYDLRNNFVASKQMDLKERRKQAIAAVAAANTAAVGTVVSPLPFSDAVGLTVIQVAMVNGIIKIYGLSGIAEISKSLVSSVAISNFGKSLAGNIFKLFPGIGSGAGTVINSGVAVSITTALGLAVTKICEESCKQILRGETPSIDKLFSYENIKMIMKKTKNQKIIEGEVVETDE